MFLCRPSMFIGIVDVSSGRQGDCCTGGDRAVTSFVSDVFFDRKLGFNMPVLQSEFRLVKFVAVEGAPATIVRAGVSTCVAFAGLTLWPPRGMMQFDERVVVRAEGGCNYCEKIIG